MQFISEHQEPRTTFADPFTGKEVVRLTGLETHCYHPYFYYQQFTADGQWLLFVSHRTGRPQGYMMELESGRSFQVTDVEDLVSFLMMLSPDGRQLLYADGPVLFRRDLHSGEVTELYRQEAPWNGGGIYPGFSEDGRFVFLSQIHREDVLPHREGQNRLLLQYQAKPRCRLVLLDTKTGAESIIREEAVFLGHPQIRPGDPNTLMYCHEGPSSVVDTRIWLIDADGTNLRPVGYERSKSPDQPKAMNTHEYFTPDGKHAAYAYFPEKYLQDGHFKMTEVDTLVETDFGPVRDYAHPFHSPCGRFVVGDEHDLGTHHETNKIWLFELATRQETPLALHGSSFAHRGPSTQDAHPHPLFTPDSKKVLFTSDRETGPEGNCALYLVTV